MHVSDFDFDLPNSLIAQEARPRGQSRLLVVRRGTRDWEEQAMAALPDLLASGDLLVVNDTRVIPARLLGRRDPSGGAAECFLVERIDDTHWQALVHPGQKLKPGSRLIFEAPAAARGGGVPERHSAPAAAGPSESSSRGATNQDDIPAPRVILRAEVLAQRFFGRRLVRFEVEGAPTVDAAIDALGHVPLPPYIRRPNTLADRERYQTVYARAPGSVAAPTAGLHFDVALLQNLEARGIGRAALTHHVGYGTFKPVRVDRVEDHRVDVEAYEIPPDAAARMVAARQAGGRIVAVGTTTTRALESAVGKDGTVDAGPGTTELFIFPGHRFQMVDALITNFHLPRSSLLMLVAAFGGTDLILAAYRDAVARGFHFYSYGDAMLIL